MKNPSEDEKKQSGLDASNEAYSHYDQVDKSQRYLLSEKDGVEEFDDDFKIRCCDMSRFFAGGQAGREIFARELGEALEDIGFAILVGHGIDPAIHEKAEEAARDLFLQTELKQKLRFRAQRQGAVNQGYFPIEETSDIHPDQVEGWVFCRRAFDLPGRDGNVGSPAVDSFWPDPKFKEVFRDLVEANERLVLPIMQSLLLHLGVDPHLFDRRLTNPSIGMRLNYYPPSQSCRVGGRLLGHEDVGMFVVLPAPKIEGLQVLNRRNMKWVRLDAPPGSIILNTGDYVQRISNDRYPSTTHRVSMPRDDGDRGRERISLPMNVYVWEDELLEVLPGLGNPHYEPIKAITFHTRSTAKFYGDDYAVNE